MTRDIAPLHPGEMLASEFLSPMDISQYRLAKAIGVDQTRISEIVLGKRSITADTDLRLCRFFGLGEGWWLRLQNEHDLAVAREALADRLEAILPLAA